MLICVLTNLGSDAFLGAQESSRGVSLWEMNARIVLYPSNKYAGA